MKTNRFGYMQVVVLVMILSSFNSQAEVIEKLGLKQGQSDARILNNDEIHTYHIRLAKDHFIAGKVIQNGVDVEVTILNPSGSQIDKFDQFSLDKEPFHFHTTESGVYQIQAKPMTINEGSYSIGLTNSEPIANSAKEKLEQMMVHYAVDEPGGVVSVVQGGELLFSNNYGLANVEYDVAINASTTFQMASASKPFTAFAIAMLADQNKLSLDDDVRKHLTWMPDFGEAITLRHLLNHSSGLKDAWNLWEMAGGRYDDIVTQQQIIEIIKNQRELNFKPGQRFQYNNGAYVLLAEVVSVVSKQKFSTWMTQNVFKPLGMESTLILDDHQIIIKQRAYSYESKYFGMKNLPVNKSFVGAVNVYTTANDLSLWLRNLHMAKVGGKQIIKRMHQKSILSDGSFKNYNFGFIILEHNGLKKIQQGGTTAGFKSLINYYPEIDAGVIVIGNTSDFNVRSIAHKTAEIFFANEMQIDNEKISPIQIPGAYSKSHRIIPLEEITLRQQKLKSKSDYVGLFYSDELKTTYQITIENNRLLLKYHRGVFPLNPKGNDRFGLNDDWLMDWDIIFERDKYNQIQRLRLDHKRAQNVRFNRIK